MSTIDVYILIISILIMLFVIKKYNILRTISYGGRLERDFRDCYIISYPKKDELHNKGEVFDINIDEFFKLNPKLKGKIPIEKRQGIKSLDALDIKLEIKERDRIKQKYSHLTKQKSKKKNKENV
ncbi:hypothetical protein H0A43_05860 [Arcobacter lanthieri]|uniref:hypothetical protein n=1 Tax=Aliarcobacter lanthieri TaxID=1355374 RepID=UPI0019222474|nr:hypothetical protein [Aliarcobacter lanthieri]MBL3519991.1 hypothetical protein [Aliarcobacter lanthieri]